MDSERRSKRYSKDVRAPPRSSSQKYGRLIRNGQLDPEVSPQKPVRPQRTKGRLKHDGGNAMASIGTRACDRLFVGVAARDDDSGLFACQQWKTMSARVNSVGIGRQPRDYQKLFVGKHQNLIRILQPDPQFEYPCLSSLPTPVCSLRQCRVSNAALVEPQSCLRNVLLRRYSVERPRSEHTQSKSLLLLSIARPQLHGTAVDRLRRRMRVDTEPTSVAQCPIRLRFPLLLSLTVARPYLNPTALCRHLLQIRVQATSAGQLNCARCLVVSPPLLTLIVTRPYLHVPTIDRDLWRMHIKAKTRTRANT